MPKIVHMTSAHPAFDTRIFQKECRTLAQAGYDVVLVAPHTHDEIVDGVQIRAVPKPKGRIARFTKTSWQVYKTAVAEDADLYHIQNELELLFWGQMLRLKGNKVIYDMHENLLKSIPTKPWINPLFRPLVVFICMILERILMRKIPVIFAENSYIKHYPWVKKNITVLNMPLTSQLLQINETKYSKPTLGYIGGVTPERGSIVTLDALKILKSKGYAVDWECIGPTDNAHRKEIGNIIKRYGLEGVRLRGYLLPSEGWPVIARCHIGLALLKPIPNYYESYPTKLFEYMALGLPVITSNFPLYRQVVEKERCGICVDPESPEETAQAVQYLLEHQDEAESMGRRGQIAAIEKYNWELEQKKLLHFYDSLLV
ncbi:MAG: glycosyltransferase [Thermacetogeniaceae bacterium]|nr:glycosyltransferase [Thermoanaerobacterales bacterium]